MYNHRSSNSGGNKVNFSASHVGLPFFFSLSLLLEAICIFIMFSAVCTNIILLYIYVMIFQFEIKHKILVVQSLEMLSLSLRQKEEE